MEVIGVLEGKYHEKVVCLWKKSGFSGTGGEIVPGSGIGADSSESGLNDRSGNAIFSGGRRNPFSSFFTG